MVVEIRGQLKFEAFADRLEDEIQAGRFKPGEAVPSVRNLMRESKLSMATVVRGLEVLERKGLVYRMSTRGFFVTDRHRTDPSVGQVALVTPALAGDTNELVKGLAGALSKNEHLTLATYSTNGDLDLYQNMIDRLARLRPTGVVITSMPPELMTVDVEPLRKLGIPIVAIGQNIPRVSCDRVDYRGGQSIRKLLPHLLERGAKDFVFFTVELLNDPSQQEMIQVLREGLAKAGMSIPDDRIFKFTTRHGFTVPADPYIDGQEAMAAVLAKGIRFKTAVFCHDYPAVGGLRAVLGVGLRVPEDIKIVSAIRCAVNGVSPQKLTTVEVNKEQQARLAGELLLRRIEGYDGPAEVHYVNGDLIIGETS
jgi:GntR family transcriptional regulator, arabinose operon transcriptional repressor